MIITLLKYLGLALVAALVVCFILFVGAMLAAVMVMVAEGDIPEKVEKKEELTDGDNEA